MSGSRTRSLLGSALRILTGLAALSLVAYVPYRYATRPPGWEGFLGTGYALLFPLSLLLALGALRVAWRPRTLAGLDLEAGSVRTAALRWGIGIYAGLWVAMGLACLPSLTALAADSPVDGLFSTVHMSAQHVLLGFGAVAAAWRPSEAAALLEGRGAAETGDRTGAVEPAGDRERG